MNNARDIFNRKQRQAMGELLEGPEPITEYEKTIWNLKCLRYSIKYGSLDYRSGAVRALDTAIKAVEKLNERQCLEEL